jgi:hypothetical protein
MALLMRMGRWTKDEVEIFSSLVTRDIKNPEIDAYWEVKVHAAQTPKLITSFPDDYIGMLSVDGNQVD